MGDREVVIEHDQGHRRLVSLCGNDGFELGRIASRCGSRPQAEGPGAARPGSRVSVGPVLRACWSAPNGASSCYRNYGREWQAEFA